jgi:hypothetical protein
MSARVLLAVLILTNPICCQMFGSTGTVRPDEPAAQCDRCACECEPCKPSNESENLPHAPCDCPNCDLCQCICAGAVVVDVVTVDNTDTAAPIIAILECGTEQVPLVSPQFCSCDAQMTCGEPNVGRTARLRYCSLLC